MSRYIHLKNDSLPRSLPPSLYT
jgi:translation initiation factor IF-2